MPKKSHKCKATAVTQELYILVAAMRRTCTNNYNSKYAAGHAAITI